MPMTVEEIIAAANAHPLGIFMADYQSARDLLVEERAEQKAIIKNGNSSSGDINTAIAAAAELTSAIGKLDEARTAFLVQVFTGAIAPSQELVEATTHLNRELARETSDANRPGAYIRIVTDYLNAANQVITGDVPAVT